MRRARRPLGLVLLASAVSVVVPAAGGAAAYGAYQRPGRNAVVSLAHDGTQSDGHSYDASPSADGSVVAFFSSASNLVAQPVHRHGNVYVRDVARERTALVSAAIDGEAPNGSSLQPEISGNGRYVAFISYATNLVRGDTADGKAAQVYVRDLVTQTTERVTTAPDGSAANRGSLGPTVSHDGQRVAFFSHASNLVPGDTNNAADVFVFDRAAGSLRRVSVGANGAEGNGLSAYPSLSGDGRVVAFYSGATNLVAGDDNGARDIFAADLETGAIDAVSVSTRKEFGNYDSFSPAIAVSREGRYVAFQSGASNFVVGDANGAGRAMDGYDVFVRDRSAGTTERISVSSAGEPLLEGLSPSISDDGRYVAFQAIKAGEDQASFVAESDVHLHDRWTGATELLSASPAGEPGRGASDNPRLTADGTRVFFQTDAADLVPGDANQAVDIVGRDRGGDTAVLAVAHTARFGEHRIHGLAAFSGVTLAHATDPAEPGDSGTDLVGAALVYRPEDADFLARIHVRAVPRVRTPSTAAVTGTTLPSPPAPGTTYGLTFALDGVRYELRASWPGQLADTATPAFALYRCASTCSRVAVLEGGWGTTGDEVRVSLPLSPMGLEPGEGLTGVLAYAAAGDGAVATPPPVDSVALGDVTLPGVTVAVGFADDGDEVTFDHAAVFNRGQFTLPLAARPPAGTRVGVRACILDRCDTAATLLP